jgi:hypothetical protein
VPSRGVRNMNCEYYCFRSGECACREAIAAAEQAWKNTSFKFKTKNEGGKSDERGH